MCFLFWSHFVHRHFGTHRIYNIHLNIKVSKKSGSPKTNMTTMPTKPLLWHAGQHQLKLLTEDFLDEGWSGAGRQVDANVVDWYTRQRHSNSHQSVDGVTVEGNHYQEYTAQAEDDWEEQGQLQRNGERKSRRWRQGQSKKNVEIEKNNAGSKGLGRKKVGRLKLYIYINKYKHY